MTKSFYFGMIEIESGHTDEQYKRFADAMNELKAAAGDIGKCAYYQIKYEHQYRKAEHEIKEGLMK